MDIFNRKKVKKLEEKLTYLRNENILLQNRILRLNVLISEAKEVQEVKHITYTVDAVILADMIKKKSKLKKVCASGYCGVSYVIPREILEKVILQTP